jgi:hypothetical protein
MLLVLEFSDAGFQNQRRTSEQNSSPEQRQKGQHAHPWLLWTKGLDLLGRNISGMATGLGKFFEIWLPDRFLDRQLALCSQDARNYCGSFEMLQ